MSSASGGGSVERAVSVCPNELSCVKSFTFTFTNAFVLKANPKEMLYMYMMLRV